MQLMCMMFCVAALALFLNSIFDKNEMEESEMYKPKPIDTTDVELSEDIMELSEKIAANVHDVWAEGRIRDGWTYGEARDDVAKTNPCLVPYDELPECEQAYDLNTAVGTLKLITKLGYKITKENKE
jgi:hypothetical protein